MLRAMLLGGERLALKNPDANCPRAIASLCSHFSDGLTQYNDILR